MGGLFSPGKLLLTSEYVVLDGALALAVPTRPGQEFFFKVCPGGTSLVWEAFHQGKRWLYLRADYSDWRILETNHPKAAAFVLHTLRQLQGLASPKFRGEESYVLRTNLQFPADYGLGSSSTLMNNLAQWAEVDAFLLNEKALGGSGYDIAVAMEKKPLLFQLTEQGRCVETVNLDWAFREELLFIHLNQKQDSREGIALYKAKPRSKEFVDRFTAITRLALSADGLALFSDLMEEHELLLASFLERETVKSLFFSDCPVFVKSLGAWGGDFVMSRKFSGWEDYFSGKGFSTVLTWNQLIV